MTAKCYYKDRWSFSFLMILTKLVWLLIVVKEAQLLSGLRFGNF